MNENEPESRSFKITNQRSSGMDSDAEQFLS